MLTRSTWFELIATCSRLSSSTKLSKGKQGLFNPKNKTKYDVIVLDTLDVAQSWAVEIRGRRSRHTDHEERRY